MARVSPKHPDFRTKDEIVRDLLNPATEVRTICAKFLIGVVVTMPEDGLLNIEFPKSMPLEFFDTSDPSYHDRWLR